MNIRSKLYSFTFDFYIKFDFKNIYLRKKLQIVCINIMYKRKNFTLEEKQDNLISLVKNFSKIFRLFLLNL